MEPVFVVAFAASEPLDRARPNQVVVAESHRQQPSRHTVRRQQQWIGQVVHGPCHNPAQNWAAANTTHRPASRPPSAAARPATCATRARGHAGRSRHRSPPEAVRETSPTTPRRRPGSRPGSSRCHRTAAVSGESQSAWPREAVAGHDPICHDQTAGCDAEHPCFTPLPGAEIG